MKRSLRIAVCILITAMILLPLSAAGVFAEGGSDTITVRTKVTYGQTEARKMLPLINEFRTGEDAWYWNADDTEKVVCADLGTLVYDYDLEAAAMQRAAEIAVCYLRDHSRPDGTMCFTALPSMSSAGENMAYSNYDFATAASMFVGFREDNDNYLGQGHRRNMLGEDYNCVGIGHVVVNGFHFWTQEFGYRSSPNTSATAAKDSVGYATVTFSADRLTFSDAYCSEESYSLELTDTMTAPEVVSEYTVNIEKPVFSTIRTYPDVVWTSSDDDVVSVSGNEFTGSSVGTAVLSAAHDTSTLIRSADSLVEIDVEVTPISISDAEVTLEYSEIEYTGSSFTPEVTSVVLGDTTLVSDTDFTVSYSNNKQVGTATVTVTGKGNYKDSASASFTVRECSHIYETDGTVASAATCTEAGERRFECTKCDLYKSEAIPATGHTEGAEATCTAAQTCTVCNAVIAQALGHTPGAAATCTADQTCTVCDAVITKAKGHTYGENADCTKDQTCAVCKAAIPKAEAHTPGAAATCTTAQTCTVCNAVIAQALGHTPGAAATCTADQTCTVCDAVITKAKGHTYGEKTDCTKDQTCTVCNAVVDKADRHTPGAAATCTTAQTCTVCKTVIAEATGHTPGAAATCTKSQTCTVCNAVIKKSTGHTDANNDKICDVCKADTSKTTNNPATGLESDTRESRNLVPVYVIGAVSIIFIACIVVFKFKTGKAVVRAPRR